MFEKAKDAVLISKIKMMIELDQSVRQKGVSDNEMLIVDSINHVEIINMIKKLNKIPGIKELGYETMREVTVLLRHLNGDTSLFNFLYPYLIKATQKGDYSPNEIADVIDYYWMTNFHPVDTTKGLSYQLYGILTFKYKDNLSIKFLSKIDIRLIY